ncbi:hypothetical protein L596_009791 [Steinernema carpocapsae]|nr:hypothetical protein L596_009791 [Steinernema carpocapsae]
MANITALGCGYLFVGAITILVQRIDAVFIACIIFNGISLIIHGFLLAAIAKRTKWRYAFIAVLLYLLFEGLFIIVAVVASSIYADGIINVVVCLPFYFYLRREYNSSRSGEIQPVTILEVELDEAGQPVFDTPPIAYAVLPIFAEPPPPYVMPYEKQDSYT